MERFLEGKTALVTGASRGIGAAIAQNLAELGALVAINYANSEAAARETLAAIEAKGGKGFLVQSHLGSLESAKKLAAGLEAELTRRTGDAGLDILINNAGGGVMANLDSTTPEIVEKAIADNVTGPLYVTQQLKSRLRQGGRIINMSSKGALQALSDFLIYCMCKSALNTFTIAMARDFGKHGVTVNAIMPGFIKTEATASILDDPATSKFMCDNTALGRLGETSDIAGVVRALVSPGMSYVTGQLIEVSGGLFI